MALGHRVMQRRLAVGVGCVERALGADEQGDHGHGADGGGAVQRVLAALVADAGRGGGGGVGEEEAREVEVVLGGDEVEDGLWVGGVRMGWVVGGDGCLPGLCCLWGLLAIVTYGSGWK